MLEISPNVLSAFEQQAELGFIAHAMAHGCQIDPDRFGALPADVRREAVIETMEIARQFGVTGQAGIICLLEARCALGPGFPHEDSFAWAQALLSTDRTDETRTLEYVRDVALAKAQRRQAHDA